MKYFPKDNKQTAGFENWQFLENLMYPFISWTFYETKVIFSLDLLFCCV